MKKLLLVAAVAAFTMTSCKKDYTCECTVTTGGISVVGTTTVKDTKKKAKETCEKGTTSSSVLGISSTTTCKIK
jgi:hypothetical protein